MSKESIVQQHKEVFVTRPTFLKRTFNFRNILFIVVLAFAVLAFLANQYKYFRFDLQITLFIQSFNFYWFDLLMKYTTIAGNVEGVVVIVALLVIYGFVIGKRHAPVVLVGSTFGGMLLSILLKAIVSRPRPDPELINQIGKFVYSDSFPSGHVMGAVSLYGFLLYITYTQLKIGVIRILVIIFTIIAMLFMGISRIYLGAHWLSDVLGAYLIGFVWLSFITFIYQRLKPKVKPS